MQFTRQKLDIARWHLSQQDLRIREQSALVSRLERSGDHRKAAHARDLLMGMQKVALQLSREVQGLNALNSEREATQDNGREYA